MIGYICSYYNKRKGQTLLYILHIYSASKISLMTFFQNYKMYQGFRESLKKSTAKHSGTNPIVIHVLYSVYGR